MLNVGLKLLLIIIPMRSKFKIMYVLLSWPFMASVYLVNPLRPEVTMVAL